MAAWGSALDYWDHLGLDRIASYERELTAYAALRLAAIDGVRVLGSPAERMSIVSFVVEGQAAGDVDRALDERGIAVRSGDTALTPPY